MMASFIGNRKEFSRYIGPNLRNVIQGITRQHKAAGGGWQECGGRGELQAAHVHDRDRNQIIDLVLDEYAGANDLVTIDLARFEERFKEEHLPVDKSFR